MQPDRAVGPEIARARTLPSAEYHDPAAYSRQCERVFARAWHLLPGAGEVRAPGHVRPFTLLPGCLDEPLVLTRAADGELRCLSNVCTHRGALVVEGEGHVRGLRCRYHGRKFGLDGCFQSMPEFEGVEAFPSAADDLPSLSVTRWGPLTFAALDPAFPFEAWIGPVRERVDWLRPEDWRLDPATSRDYVLDAHWALYVDNYLEEFHIPYVHGASLAGAMDYQGYHTLRFELGNLQVGSAGEGEPTLELPAGHPEEGQRVGALYFWLFPSLMLNVYPWGLSLNVVEPLGPSRTRVRFLSYVADPSVRASGLGGDLHRVEMEDEEIVESVQAGVRSRLYDRGRYSPRREVGTHHFHVLLQRFLGDAEPAF